MLAEVKVPYIVFAGSFPREKEIAAAKATGAKVLCFASTISIAERMIRFGADAIILEGSEAGGHIGHVSTTVLVQQVLYRFCDQIPIFVAGGIGTGKMMAHMLLMGAAGRPARHPVRHDRRIQRPPRLQGGVHSCQRTRRGQ